MKNKVLILLPLIASLAACGGGNSSATSGLTSTGTVSLLVTDDLTQSYSEVWVNIQSITATDANNQTVTLYQDATGQTHNLSQLANVGALVDAQSVAAGTYTSFQITLANSVKLVDLGGAITNASFDQSGNSAYTMTVPGNLTVDANQLATLVFDFNLQQFIYDAGTNTVTPAVAQTDPGTLSQTVATTPGQVQSVVSPTQFILAPATGGANIIVNLHSNATVINASSGAVTTDTSALQPGMPVRISGSYDSTTLTITAASVLIKNSDVIVRDQIEGVVTQFDGATLTVDVREASFTPDSNTLNIINFATASFSRGNLALLATGQKVEIKGALDSNGDFSAALIEIEGAIRNSSTERSHSYTDRYVELKGEISAVNGAMLTLTVSKSEHVTGISNGSSVTINSGNSWISEGNSSCLVAGAQIEVKGAMSDAVTMDASMIEIEGGCGSSGTESDHDGEEDAGDDETDDQDSSGPDSGETTGEDHDD